MLRPSGHLAVYLYTEAVDMRKSIDGLSALVEQGMDQSAFSEAIFVFVNRTRDKVKLLLWERNGFIVWYKRVEKQRFPWPTPQANQASVSLNITELNYLLDGIDIFHYQAHKTLNYRAIG